MFIIFQWYNKQLKSSYKHKTRGELVRLYHGIHTKYALMRSTHIDNNETNLSTTM